MRQLTAALWFGVGLVLSEHVLAQELKLLPNQSAASALACLTQTSDDADLKLGEKDNNVYALIRFKLRFESAEHPPIVENIFSRGSIDVIERIRRYVSTYRLPCWKKETGPVEAVQEFSLSSNAPIQLWPKDDASASTASKSAPEPDCKVNSPKPGSSVFRGAELPITILAFITFPTKSTHEPRVEIRELGSLVPVGARLKKHIEQSYRTDCAAFAGVTAMQTFKFVSSGQEYRGFVNKSFTLNQWLPHVKKDKLGDASFDFNSMDCPFSVRLDYWQPLEENYVVDIDRRNPNRAAFLNWLRGHQLALSKPELEHLFGSSALINVPCGTLDLRKPT